MSTEVRSSGGEMSWRNSIRLRNDFGGSLRGRAEGKKYLQRYVEVAMALPEGKRDEQKIRLAKQLIRAIDAVKGGF